MARFRFFAPSLVVLACETGEEFWLKPDAHFINRASKKKQLFASTEQICFGRVGTVHDRKAKRFRSPKKTCGRHIFFRMCDPAAPPLELFPQTHLYAVSPQPSQPSFFVGPPIASKDFGPKSIPSQNPTTCPSFAW